MKDIDIIFFDAGGGHRAAATALCQVIQQQQRPWRARMVNLQEVLDSLDVFRKITGSRLEDLYNLMLRKGWTLGSIPAMRFMQAVIRLHHRKQVALLREFWAGKMPDLVVSVVPHFNRAIWEGMGGDSSKTPLVTIVTDLADYPPHFWIESKQKQAFIFGTDRGVEQARALAHADVRAFRVSGMVLDPRFYEVAEVDRRMERRRLGLDPDKPTGLMMFGGQGSTVMMDIARRLARSHPNLQLIAICGRNQRLTQRMREFARGRPMVVEGFTKNIPYYMQLSDFLIGKPGPGSISEAVAMRLPVIIERNAWTLPQERYNADWVLEKQVGLVVSSFRNIDSAVSKLLAPGTLERYRANTAAIENRALFEIADILDGLLTMTTC